MFEIFGGGRGGATAAEKKVVEEIKDRAVDKRELRELRGSEVSSFAMTMELVLQALREPVMSDEDREKFMKFQYLKCERAIKAAITKDSEENPFRGRSTTVFANEKLVEAAVKGLFDHMSGEKKSDDGSQSGKKTKVYVKKFLQALNNVLLCNAQLKKNSGGENLDGKHVGAEV